MFLISVLLSKGTLTASEFSRGLPWRLSGKEPACQHRRRGFDPWVGKFPWRRENGNALQCSCLGDAVNRGAWWATVQGVSSQARLGDPAHVHTWKTPEWRREKAGGTCSSALLCSLRTAWVRAGESPLSSQEAGAAGRGRAASPATRRGRQVQWPRITGIGALRGGPEALPNQPGSVQILTVPDTAT